MTALAFLVLATSQTSAPIDVMTFNIRYGTADDKDNRWEVRKSRTLKALQKRHPAIVGLQEALDFQVDDLRKALKGYQAVGVGRDDGKSAGEYSAILYDASRFRVLRTDTFWLSDTPEIVASKTWGNNITRICTWAYFQDLKTGRYFYHFNTHLDHQSQPSREASAALILEKIKRRGTNDPVVFTGDFNVGEDNPVATVVKGGGFLDTFRVLHPDAQNVGTFNGFRPECGKDKIDYIWVDSRWTVKSAEIVLDKVNGFWISDHVPVIATIEPTSA